MMRISAAVLAVIVMACGCRTPQGSLAISVRKTDQHPFLIDHARVLVATVGGKKIDTQPLYPDPGAGTPLHYVLTGDTITAVDANGMWYKVTRKRIKKLKWHWLTPLPQGQVRRIALDKNKKYTDTKIDKVDLNDVYKYKDPDD